MAILNKEKLEIVLEQLQSLIETNEAPFGNDEHHIMNKVNDNSTSSLLLNLSITGNITYWDIFTNTIINDLVVKGSLIDEIYLPTLKSIGGSNYVESNADLITIEQSALISIGGDNHMVDNFLSSIDQTNLQNVLGDNKIHGNANLISMLQPALSKIGGCNSIQSNGSLTSIAHNLLSMASEIEIINNSSLSEVSLSGLAEVFGDLKITDNEELNVIYFGTLFPFAKNYYFQNNILSADEVNNLLIKAANLVSNGDYSTWRASNGYNESPNLYLNGTNSAPGFAGLTAKSSLEGAGWNVLIS